MHLYSMTISWSKNTVNLWPQTISKEEVYLVLHACSFCKLIIFYSKHRGMKAIACQTDKSVLKESIQKYNGAELLC